MHENLSKEKNKQRTEEVAAIVERMPMRFSLFVSAIIIIIGILLCFFGWKIKYPDLVKAQISISASQAPVKLVANISGKLEILLHTPGQIVKSDDYIAVIKNPASTADIRLTDSLLSVVDIHQLNYATRHFFPEKVSLGEVNNKYFAFLTAFYQYIDYYHNDPIGKQEAITRSLLNSQQNLLKTANDQSIILDRKYKLAARDFVRDSNLFANHVIDPSDIDKSNLSLINYEQEAKAISKELYTDQYQIEDASNKLEQLSVQKNDKERELQVGLLDSYFELKENIRQWEKNYVFMAPFSGRLEYLSFWKDGDFVSAGKEIFSVIPDRKEIYGQVMLPESGAGKVKIGQEVIIKLNNFPYEEFGVIKGKVQNISLVTNQQVTENPQVKSDMFLVNVELPSGLTTNYGKALDFYFEAKGSVEIIVNNRRLYERLFDNLKYRIK